MIYNNLIQLKKNAFLTRFFLCVMVGILVCVFWGMFGGGNVVFFG